MGFREIKTEVSAERILSGGFRGGSVPGLFNFWRPSRSTQSYLCLHPHSPDSQALPPLPRQPSYYTEPSWIASLPKILSGRIGQTPFTVDGDVHSQAQELGHRHRFGTEGPESFCHRPYFTQLLPGPSRSPSNSACPKRDSLPRCPRRVPGAAGPGLSGPGRLHGWNALRVTGSAPRAAWVVSTVLQRQQFPVANSVHPPFFHT